MLIFKKMRSEGNLLLLVCVAGYFGAGVPNMEALDNTISNGISNYLKCGPNSLFLFLFLSGRNQTKYSDVDAMPIASEGVSMLELQQAAKNFGINTEIRWYKIDNVGQLSLPAIALLTSDSSILRYHFGVIYRINKRNVFLIDGTTGQLETVKRDRFQNIWTGYAMCQKWSFTVWMNEWKLTILLSLSLFILDVIYFLRYFNPKPLRRVFMIRRAIECSSQKS